MPPHMVDEKRILDVDRAAPAGVGALAEPGRLACR